MEAVDFASTSSTLVSLTPISFAFCSTEAGVPTRMGRANCISAMREAACRIRGSVASGKTIRRGVRAARSRSWVTRSVMVSLFYGRYRQTLAFLFNFNAVPLDLLIQGGEWNSKIVCGFGLTPTGSFQHFDNHSPFKRIHDIEKGTVCRQIE